MKPALSRLALILSVVTATVSSMPTFAQSTPTPATAAPEAAAPSRGYKTVEPREVADYPLPSTVDPRVCLEFSTTAQIIACAERYRPRGKRAQAPA